MKKLKGMHDIYYPEVSYYSEIEEIAKKIFANYGFLEIRTPIMEETALFKRTVGEETDIVSKEMYSFYDRDKQNICLRPENTASVVRAYLENKMSENLLYNKLFYIGPMFRRERPQKGRYRQFYQIGAEFINNPDPSAEVELLALLQSFFKILGLKDLYTEINSIGCKICRPNYRKELMNFLKNKKNLCDDCLKRSTSNPLRVLDCKSQECKDIISDVPSPVSHLCSECSEHYLKLIDYLKESSINYVENKFMVRGLDYYTKSVFEIKSKHLGSQNTLCGGGRYDDLFEILGGPITPAVGFSLGMERLVIILKELKNYQKETDICNDVFFAALGDEAKKLSLALIIKLKNDGFKTEIDFSKNNLKKLMKVADKTNSKYTFIIGDDEIKKGVGILRNMKTKDQYDIDLKNIYCEVVKYLSGEQNET